MRRLTFLVFFFYAFIFFPNILSAQSNEVNGKAVFEEANLLFSQKKYDEAIQKYELLLENDLVSAETYFNLGNAFSQKEEWGDAILNYERALLLSPNDKTILNNLDFANAKTPDEFEKIPKFFLAQWWSNVRNLTSSGIWSLLGILLFWIGIAGIILWILGKERTQRKKGFLAGWACLGLSFLIFGLAYSSFQVQKNSGTAIVMEQEVPLQTLPDAISTPILQIHKGTKVKIIEKLTSWYKVRLENGEIGWITETAIEEI